MTREEYNREYRSLADARDMAVKVNDKKLAKHYRQQISWLYEEHGKDLKEAPIEQAKQDRLDAQRYRKLKAWLKRETHGEITEEQIRNGGLDAAVDALPDVTK